MTGFGDLAIPVAEAFGLGTPARPMREVAGGEQARIWRLDTDRGSYAVKQPRRGMLPRTDGSDIAFLEAIQAQTDILVPEPVRGPDGLFVIAVGDTAVRVSGWVDLKAPDNDLDPTEVGRLFAALHTVDFPLPASARVDPWYCAPVGRDRWLELASDLRAGAAPFASEFTAEVPTLLRLEELLEPPADLRMCHCDLWSDNVLRTSDGRLCVIDWDNCGPADPAHELACAVLEYGRDDPARVAALIAAYQEAGGPARLVRPGQFTMLIAQFGHFWASAAELWLDPESGDEERAHAEDRVAELLDPPLTPEQIDDLLAAAG